MKKQTANEKPLGDAIDSAAAEIFSTFQPLDGSFFVTDAASDNSGFLMVSGEIFAIFVSNDVLQLNEPDLTESQMDDLDWSIRFDAADPVFGRITVEAL